VTSVRGGVGGGAGVSALIAWIHLQKPGIYLTEIDPILIVITPLFCHAKNKQIRPTFLLLYKREAGHAGHAHGREREGRLDRL